MAHRNRKAIELDNQIGRFEKSARRRIRKLAGLSPRLADLVHSFPAAAYVIATGSVQADQAGVAVRLVKDGESLKDVAQALKLPIWTKRLPPEAFMGKVAGLPDGEKFARQISGRIPQNPAYANGWLSWVSIAGAAADEEFALWVAGQQALFRRTIVGAPDSLRPLAAYAWFSRRKDGIARELINRPWQPSVSFEKATLGMQGWLDRIAARFRPVRPRRGPGRYSMKLRKGLTMVPLRTGPELREEGHAMDHCVATYAHLVAAGECQIFSVRDGAKRVATVEIRRRRDGRGFAVVQLQGPSNSRVERPVEEFVRVWVDRYSADPEMALRAGVETYAVKASEWNEIWGPYIAEKGKLGFEPTPTALERLIIDADMLRMAR